HERLAKSLNGPKKVDVALAEIYQAAEQAAQKEMVGGKPPSLDTYVQWQHAIRCSAATDNLGTLFGVFKEPETPLMIRWLCIQSMQQWIAWDRDKDYELMREVRKVYKQTVTEKIMKLMHAVTTEDAQNPATYEYLIESLNNDVLPIRTLSHFHLTLLA